MSTGLLIWTGIALAATVALLLWTFSRARVGTTIVLLVVASGLSIVLIAEVTARVYDYDRGMTYIVVGSIEGAMWLWSLVKALFEYLSG